MGSDDIPNEPVHELLFEIEYNLCKEFPAITPMQVDDMTFHDVIRLYSKVRQYQIREEDIREILRTLCQWKGVEIIEGEVCPDHIHLLLSIPPKMSVSGFMGYLKGKSSLMIFQKYGNMKFAYRNREFWCKGYYVDTVGKNTKAIKEYIADQLKRDKEADQLSIYDPRDPFTGSK